MSTSLDAIMEEEKANAGKHIHQQHKNYSFEKRYQHVAPRHARPPPQQRHSQSHSNEYSQIEARATPTFPIETLMICDMNNGEQHAAPEDYMDTDDNQQLELSKTDDSEPMDVMSLQTLSIREIQMELDKQRLKNEELIHQNKKHPSVCALSQFFKRSKTTTLTLVE